jgi:hypothetical protein
MMNNTLRYHDDILQARLHSESVVKARTPRCEVVEADVKTGDFDFDDFAIDDVFFRAASKDHSPNYIIASLYTIAPTETH